MVVNLFFSNVVPYLLFCLCPFNNTFFCNYSNDKFAGKIERRNTGDIKRLGPLVFFSYMLLNFLIFTQRETRLILGYLTISPSSESPSSKLMHFPSSGRIFKHEYLIHNRPSLVSPFTLNGTHFSKLLSGRLSMHESNCNCLSRSPPQTIDSDTIC